MGQNIPCAHCGRSFAGDIALIQHTKAVHGRKAARVLPGYIERQVKRAAERNEPSMADLVIEAST